jgi:hypothetical protein
MISGASDGSLRQSSFHKDSAIPAGSMWNDLPSSVSRRNFRNCATPFLRYSKASMLPLDTTPISAAVSQGIPRFSSSHVACSFES